MLITSSRHEVSTEHEEKNDNSILWKIFKKSETCWKKPCSETVLDKGVENIKIGFHGHCSDTLSDGSPPQKSSSDAAEITVALSLWCLCMIQIYSHLTSLFALILWSLDCRILESWHYQYYMKLLWNSTKKISPSMLVMGAFALRNISHPRVTEWSSTMSACYTRVHDIKSCMWVLIFINKCVRGIAPGI